MLFRSEEMDIEVEPIEVEVESGSDGQDITFSEEDKTLVNELFDISTYCLAQPRNPRQEEEEGDESDFSINDIL